MTDVTTLTRDAAPCGACANGVEAPFAFSMAFQPIVDIERQAVYAYEALVRGPESQPAPTVLGQVNLVNRYAFDQSCRVKAIEMAARLGLRETGAKLSINFIPGAMYRPEACVRATLAAAQRCQLGNDNIVLELTENEQIVDTDLLRRIFDTYRRHHLRIAIDDFGAGFSGLVLLARFQPDVVKIDMELVRGLDHSARRRTIVAAIVGLATELEIDVVAEGVETAAEATSLRNLGVTLIQGYLFARPAFEAFPAISF